MKDAAEFKREQIGSRALRIRTPEGWIVDAYPGGICYVPDHDHKWAAGDEDDLKELRMSAWQQGAVCAIEAFRLHDNGGTEWVDALRCSFKYIFDCDPPKRFIAEWTDVDT